ncbi:MAG: AsmA-like C-terminal domain-containing protein, partial [Deltaproteobacteria bacterium]|nr:AsmA-like C-terminal domain-containing protein [Deltaproteobacteria bacterium]
KPNPHFTLKVESPFLPLATFKNIFPTPFVRPWVKEKIFPVLSGGDARLVHFSMNGTRDQLKHLRLPENRKAISMKIEWKEIDALRDGGGLPFERVSGELNIENGALSTSITHAVFGNSIITSASLDVSSLYEARTYCVSEEGLFDLQDIKQQENLDVMPSGARGFLQRFKNVSGKLEGSSRVSFEKGWGNPRVLMGEFHFTDCSTELNGLHLPLILNEAAIHIDGDGEPQFQGVGRWGRSEFRVSGSTDRLWKVSKARIESRVHVNGIIDLFFQGITLPLKQTDLIPIKAALTKKQNVWLIQGETNLDGVALETDSISLCPSEKCKEAVFDMAIFPGEKVCLNSLKYNLGESAFELNGSFDLISKDIIHVNVFSEKLLLKDLGIRFRNENAPTRGVVSCRAEVQVPLKDPSKTSVTGVVTGRNISLNLDRMASPVNDCHMILNFAEKDISIRSLSMRMGESLLDIHGDVQGWDGLKGKITANADFLNVSDFIPKKAGTEDKISTHGSFWKSSDIQLILNARKGKWKKLTFAPLKAECDFRSNDFCIKTVDAQIAHGTVSAKGHVKGEQGPERLFLTCEIKLKKQPFDDLEDSLGFKRGVEGLLTLEASLSAKGGETQDLISGLTGSADILLEEGKIIREQGIVFKILEFLSLRNMINWDMPDFSKTGFDFEALEAHVDITEGNLETDSFIFKSAIFNATAQGTIFLPTETVDFDFWIQTLEAIDFVVGNVPIIGYILTEKENSPKGVIIYPLEVDGNWSNPKVKSSVLKNLGPGVINIFKRILLTPGHIFKEISEFTKRIVKMNGTQNEKNIECDNPAIAQ